jgi:hypothetical protein
MVTPGPMISPQNLDRDSRARDLKANRLDIKALANVPYHCGVEEGVLTLTPDIIMEVGYSNIGSADVVACHNDIIDTHRKTVEQWHNTAKDTYGPQVHLILHKSLKLLPVLDSTSTAAMVEF